VACCLCLVVFGAGAAILGILNIQSDSTQELQARPEFSVPTAIVGSAENPGQAVPFVTPLPLPPAQVDQSVPPVSNETLQILENTTVPISDLLDLARRLEGKEDIPETVDPPPAPYQVGTPRSFWVANVDTNENFLVDTTLRYVTDHLYFWIENGIRYSEAELSQLAETFEREIYPTTRAFFGSEWTPGVDGDPHLYVVFATGLGNNVAGYYSSADQYHQLAHEYSNAHEMFLLNADNLWLDDTFTYGVLAHEFQHMIHWYQDRNEETWLNEGFSELAAFLNGYGTGGSDTIYAQDTDHQLNTWPNDGDTLPHYGSAFLFVNYFLNRYGEEATQSVVSHPSNGLASIDQILADLNAVDPLTGLAVGADQVFADWAVANYLHDLTVGDGRYGYANYAGAPEVDVTQRVNRCPLESYQNDVSQYGVDYYEISCSGDYLLQFEGSAEVNLLPENPYSGNYAFWSNQGDESNMTLTREFDFTLTSRPLTLKYWTWYDLEQDYDYVYVLASTDGGERWDILLTPNGTGTDPSGNSYGWAYNGQSGFDAQWIQESVDISDYAGKKVLLRFEYVTDAAVNGEGFLLDDVSVPEIGYFSDFESDDGGWVAAGFARIQNILPQTYQVSLVYMGDTTSVQTFSINSGDRLEVPLSLGGSIDQVTLVVSGTTRHTRQPAVYQFSVLPQP
jgi:immune inhibitor A